MNRFSVQKHQVRATGRLLRLLSRELALQLPVILMSSDLGVGRFDKYAPQTSSQ